MLLSDATIIKALANGRVAVAEGPGKVAQLLAADAPNVFECSWLVEARSWEGERQIVPCGAVAVGFDNGFACEHGHSHFSGVEYYEADEVASYTRRGIPLAPNARLIDGRPV